MTLTCAASNKRISHPYDPPDERRAYIGAVRVCGKRRRVKSGVELLLPPSRSHTCATMSLLHALVARDATILAEHSTAGNEAYTAAIGTILSKIPAGDSKLTYAGTLFRTNELG